jgi:hypothetical protein
MIPHFYDFRVDQLPVLAIICFVLIVSRSLWAIIAIMIALILGLIALVLRLEYPSPFTNWFETTAEILTRTVLLWVVAVAVFSNAVMSAMTRCTSTTDACGYSPSRTRVPVLRG